MHFYKNENLDYRLIHIENIINSHMAISIDPLMVCYWSLTPHYVTIVRVTTGGWKSWKA